MERSEILKVTVEAGFTDDGKIMTRTVWPGQQAQTMAYQVLDTQEKAVRQALVQMGWAPPGRNPREIEQSDLDILIGRIAREAHRQFSERRVNDPAKHVLRLFVEDLTKVGILSVIHEPRTKGERTDPLTRIDPAGR